MRFRISKSKFTRLINVPSSEYCLFAFVIQLLPIVLGYFLLQLISCEAAYHSLIQPATSQYDYYFDDNNGSYEDNEIVADRNNLHQPTPPLELNFITSTKNKRQAGSEINENGSGYQADGSVDNNISPARVLANHYTFAPDSNLFSPIFNFQSIEADNNLPVADLYKSEDHNEAQLLQQQQQRDSNDAFDLLEQGSGVGVGWDTAPILVDTNNVLEDTTVLAEYEPTPIMPTPMLTPNFDQQTPHMGDRYNRPPSLNRRLPKLGVTAGQVWRYFIPLDTFIDEDGDLRNLKSAIFSKRSANLYGLLGSNNSNTIGGDENSTSVGQYYSWLQYDQTSQLLYGFPTENEAGKHEFVLVVSDRLGSTSEEIIEINVRQHQSTRAFTHLFTINGVTWDNQRYPSMIDALGEFVKRISVRVYSDQPFNNFIVQYYSINSSSGNLDTTNNFDPKKNTDPSQIDQASTVTSFNIGWSNSSIPIHPCNLSHLETLFKYLIDTQTINYDWSLDKDNKLELAPSQNLIKALGPEFKPSSVSIRLLGACESIDSLQNNNIIADYDNLESTPRVKIKIGKLTWKLGEPIEYRIPAETFEAERGNKSTKDLQLTLHTIDGSILDKDPRYSFLEFDQETQTIFGLPYDQTDHAGQKEMQLTARHPKSGHKVREVFIINIEPQDLTTINNRAFLLSLYFMTRIGPFGARDRVMLSHKVVAALRLGDGEFYHNQRENPELIVINIEKYVVDSGSRSGSGQSQILDGSISEDDVNQDKITRVLDTISQQGEEFYASRDGSPTPTYLYKYTWTNGTVGYRGDCPVEVIKENILSAIETSMLELRAPRIDLIETSEKNDTDRFYDHLRLYFEPELDMIQLRFVPLGACSSAFKVHDVGNGDIADHVDRASDQSLETAATSSNNHNSVVFSSIPYITNITMKPDIETDNDEFWSIVVLIVLVVALIFVIVMFFLGMRTYKINQDKRFELQVRLAQARQNSMYLSSMILANQATPCEIINGQMLPKPMYVIQDEDKGSRKPVILDNEKRLLKNGGNHDPTCLKPTTVHLSGHTVHTTPLKHNMTFTLDSVPASWQQPPITTLSLSPSTMMSPYMDEKQRSMTMHRKASSTMQRLSGKQASMNNLNHSQSILTVASLAGPLPMIPQGRVPMLYAQVPVVGEQPPQTYSSLQRYHQHRSPSVSLANGIAHNGPKTRSPSYSSSASATTQSVISNPNYAPIS